MVFIRAQVRSRLPAMRGLVRRLHDGCLMPAVDLLFPPRCLLCARDVAAEGPRARRQWAVVCDACADEMPAGGDRCRSCGEIVEGRLEVEHRCRGARWSRMAVLCGYDGPVREAVLRGKRPGGEDACRALGSLWVERHAASAMHWRCDLVVPVPLHWTRRLARGTSSADRIAAAISAGLGLRMSHALARVRATRMQNELPPEERAANVAGAFRCTGRVSGRRVMLVDDVTTTGSTLAACCDTLMRAGAADVCVAVIAKADRHPPKPH